MAAEPVVRAPMANCDCAAASKGWDFPAEASGLLGEIQARAAQLSQDSDKLESFTRMRLSWQSHAYQLTVAREHVNEIGRRIQRLQAIRDLAAPWQRQAIDSILPVAVNLAKRTESAIGHVNENRNYLWAASYVDHLQALKDHAGEMKQAVDLHLEIASTQDRLEQLRQRLEDSRS
jgi:hypothetical protein